MNFNNTLGSTFGALEFIRPYWLLGLLIVLVFSLLRYQRSRLKQTNVIAPHLSEHLVTLPETAKNNRLALNSLAVIACIALSGPSIRSVDIPVYEMQKAQVIALDLSYSMYAKDAKPNRLSQAKYKTIDLLKQWTEGEKALIAYAGDAFTISPLTLDSNAIINHIPHLAPDMMPVRGSRPDLALEKAISLLENSGYQQGHIVFVTDGFDEESAEAMQTMIKGSKWIVSVLAMATPSGAPITLPDGTLLKDNSGQIVIPRLEDETLYPITRSTDGLYLTFDPKGQDITLLSNHYQNQKQRKESNNEQRQVENKQLIDDGYWLSFLLLPLFLLLFRKGVFYVALLALTLPLSTPKVEASVWKNSQQNAYQSFETGDYEAASESFDNSAWKAAALFKNKQYKQAEAAYLDQLKEDPNNADMLYNLGNTQAIQEDYEQALDSFNKALAIAPGHQPAQKNKKIIEDLLKEQEKQKNEQQSSENQEQNEQKEEQPSDEQQQNDQQQEQQPSDEQQQSEQQQEQQQDEQQSADQQPSEQQQQNKQEQQSDQQSSKQEDQQAADQAQSEQQSEQQKQEQLEKEQKEAEQKEAQEASESEQQTAEEKMATQLEAEQPVNEEYEALPTWLKNMPDDPSLLLRNKMRQEYRKRSSNKPVLHKNDGEIW